MSNQVVIVSSAGEAQLTPVADYLAAKAAREAEQQAALEQIKLRATAPIECGLEIPVSPGRGPMVRFTPREMRQTEGGSFVSIRSGEGGHDGARVADAFDTMERAARKAHAKAEAERAKKGEKPKRYEPLFTPGQISAARDYAALVERCEASGVKCSSLETIYSGSSGGGDREEAMLADFQRLRALQRRMGDALAKEVRRIRPSQNGGKTRRTIYVRRLVDLVCCGGMTLGEVLTLHGWAKDGRATKALRQSLCAALDRMQGYDLATIKKGIDT